MVPTRFSESLNEKNQMCELCMFPQIRSHISLYIGLLVCCISGKEDKFIGYIVIKLCPIKVVFAAKRREYVCT